MSLFLLVLAVPVGFFLAAKLAEKWLGAEHRIGRVLIRVHGPAVSPWASAGADSITVFSPDFRLDAVRPTLRLSGFFGFGASGSIVRLGADSIAVSLRSGRKHSGEKIPFPAGLRFPVGFSAEWRALTLSAAGSPAIHVGAAAWRSRGSQALGGEFRVSPPFGAEGPDSSRGVAVKVRAGWRGVALRYEIRAFRGREDSLRISGIRDKRDLRKGWDSLALSLGDPAAWLPGAMAPEMPALSRLRVAGLADWSKRTIRAEGGIRTGPVHMMRAAAWNFETGLNPAGGTLSLRGEGDGQSVHVRGSWSHPETWLALPDWKRCRAEFTAGVRGGDWVLGRWKLPLDFDVPVARLDRGLLISSQIVTRDKSKIDLRWAGDRPGRIDFSGPVSPSETWALAWTGAHVSFGEARVEGHWENARLLGSTRIREPKAYGAAADSLEAEHEVTSSGYFLRSARIHKGADVFAGNGQVLWKHPAGPRGVTLRFEAWSPGYGRGVFEMPVPGRMAATAESLRVARFPYEPLARFASFDPRVDGRFEWDLHDGRGGTEVTASVVSAGNILHSRLKADWDRDTLRARVAEMTTGESRLAATASLPLQGRSLPGLSGAKAVTGGAWRIDADHIRLGDVYALAGKSARTVDGLVNGSLERAPGPGLTGRVRMDNVRIPGLREWAQIDGVTLEAMGDSLSLGAVSVSKRSPVLNDTLRALISGFGSQSPRFRVSMNSPAGFRAAAAGLLPDWKRLEGTLSATGTVPLGEKAGLLEDVVLGGALSAPLNAGFLNDLTLGSGSLHARYVAGLDTQVFSGTPVYGQGTFRVENFKVRNSSGGEALGWAEARLSPLSVRADLAGESFSLALADGHRFTARDLTARAEWQENRELSVAFSARTGSFALPPAPYRVESGYDNLRVEIALPPQGPEAPPARALVRARLKDFFFQRKLGFKDATAFFGSFSRNGARGNGSFSKRSRAWDLDMEVGAAGTRNRVDTDVLRMTFIGDVQVKGVYPYTLVRGNVSGLQGEIGQVRQSYSVRDFSVKWDNVTLDDGVLYVEGEKKLRADCRTDTKQTCQIYVKLDGRLHNVNFTYDTDCGQNAGEPVAPAVLMSSMTQGCYAAGLQSGESGYGGAALGMLEPVLNEQLSRGLSLGSRGFIKSTQVSGLGALMGGDSANLESVGLEVESREIHRVGFKARAAYHPEIKQANPWESRIAAEYRPPLEKFASDSAWRVRLKDRFTVEAAAESRPEARDVEDDRRVRQRAGLRYRYRFWDLW